MDTKSKLEIHDNQWINVICPRGNSWDIGFYYNCFHQSSIDSMSLF